MHEIIKLAEVVGRLQARAVKDDGVDALALRRLTGFYAPWGSRPGFTWTHVGLEHGIGIPHDPGVGARLREDLGEDALQPACPANEHFLVVERSLFVRALRTRQLLRHWNGQTEGLDQFSGVLIFEQKIRHESSAPH